MYLLHRVRVQIFQEQEAVLDVLSQHAFGHQHTGHSRAQLLQYCFQIGVGGDVDPAEHLAGVVTVAGVAPGNIHPVQEQHLQMHIQVQSRAEALDEGYCTGACGAVGEASLVNEPGSDGAIDKPQGLSHQVRVAGKQEA